MHIFLNIIEHLQSEMERCMMAARDGKLEERMKHDLFLNGCPFVLSDRLITEAEASVLDHLTDVNEMPAVEDAALDLEADNGELC